MEGKEGGGAGGAQPLAEGEGALASGHGLTSTEQKLSALLPKRSP